MKVHEYLDADKYVTEQRRQKRKKKHVAKRKGKIDHRTGKRGKSK